MEPDAKVRHLVSISNFSGEIRTDVDGLPNLKNDWVKAIFSLDHVARLIDIEVVFKHAPVLEVGNFFESVANIVRVIVNIIAELGGLLL